MANNPLHILLIGSGGREHVLAWKLAMSSRVSSIHVVPGNGGTAGLPKTTNVPSVSPSDFPALVQYAHSHLINLLLPGPEAPLIAGIIDYFRLHGPTKLLSFGPSAAAARLEGSKAYAKAFMARHGIPTAAYRTFTSAPQSYVQAQHYLSTVDPATIVLKADGLASGKGVLLPSTRPEAEAALRSILVEGVFGDAGLTLVIEDRLQGEEISLLSLCDGRRALTLPPAQDHKRVGEGDTGPNTGGMGAYAPTPLATVEQLEEIERVIIQPTLDGMREEGVEFRGCLFTGIMLTAAGPKVLEYNVRFGDPETQVLMPLTDGDLAELLLACCEGGQGLDGLDGALRVKTGVSACTVVMAAGGYPGEYAKGTPIEILPPVKHLRPQQRVQQEISQQSSDGREAAEEEDQAILFHAGTSLSAPSSTIANQTPTLVTSGGRVIASTATGSNLHEAVDKAYAGIARVKFEGMHYRRDIGARALS